MNYNESSIFYDTNTRERVIEKLTQQSMRTQQLESQVNGDGYWSRYFSAHILVGEKISVHPMNVYSRAMEMLNYIKEQEKL